MALSAITKEFYGVRLDHFDVQLDPAAANQVIFTSYFVAGSSTGVQSFAGPPTTLAMDDSPAVQISADEGSFRTALLAAGYTESLPP